MAKPSRGTTRSAASKKKTAKKRPEPRPVAAFAPSAAAREAVQPQEGAQERAPATVVQFRPRSREFPAAKTPGRAASARAAFPVIDYGYVFTDLKMIGALAGFLLVGLIALTFVIR